MEAMTPRYFTVISRKTNEKEADRKNIIIRAFRPCRLSLTTAIKAVSFIPNAHRRKHRIENDRLVMSSRAFLSLRSDQCIPTDILALIS